MNNFSNDLLFLTRGQTCLKMFLNIFALNQENFFSTESKFLKISKHRIREGRGSAKADKRLFLGFNNFASQIVSVKLGISYPDVGEHLQDLLVVSWGPDSNAELRRTFLMLGNLNQLRHEISLIKCIAALKCGVNRNAESLSKHFFESRQSAGLSQNGFPEPVKVEVQEVKKRENACSVRDGKDLSSLGLFHSQVTQLLSHDVLASKKEAYDIFLNVNVALGSEVGQLIRKGSLCRVSFDQEGQKL